MKRYGDLFRQITGFKNLLSAARKAQKGKRFKESTSRFNLNLEHNLIRLQQELLTQTYAPGPYTDFTVYDPKRRLISAAPYRDRVVHHALCNIIEPIFDNTFIHDSYACRKEKGTHAAVNRYTAFAGKNKYVLKCDIEKYFQSIDHEILMEMVSRKIKCPQTLWLIRGIIASRNDTSHIRYFKTDDIFTPFNRKKGIPIGNLTSQFFANIYLNGFDHFVKSHLKCRHYIRYVDDFVAFGNDKSRLKDVKCAMEDHLENLRIGMHERKSRIYRVTDGVTFLGYRMFPDHRLLKKDNALRMRRKMRKMAGQYLGWEISFRDVHQRVQSWTAHARHADTFKLRGRVLGSVTFQRGEAGTPAGRATGTTRTTGTTNWDFVAPGLES